MKEANYSRMKINFIFDLEKIESSISIPCDFKIIIK